MNNAETIAKTPAISANSSPKDAHWYTLSFKSGEKLDAPLLHEDDTRVVAELAGQLLSFRRELIEELKPLESKDSQNNERKMYTTSDKKQILPLQKQVKNTQGAVVSIMTPSGLGSGFFISSEGHLITNTHVVEGETRITVTQYINDEAHIDKINFKDVKIIAIGPDYDLALLQVKLEKGQSVPFLPLGKSENLNRGEELFGIGNPLGLERSVSQGIASVLDRTFGGIRYIQTTVQVNPGNSGGPLLNMKGEVVGVINMKIMFAEGLGFAIPSFYLRDFLNNYTAYLYDTRQANTGVIYSNPPF